MLNFNINNDVFRVCKFKSIEKTINRIFSTKKNNVNFFPKIDNDNFITKIKKYFVQKQIKTILNKKIKNEINIFSKKKNDHDIKNSRILKNRFIILN